MFGEKNYFKDMYDDFFGVESLKGVTLEKEEENDSSKLGSQEEMASLFERINKLYVNEESKNLLKKIIEYMRKYQEKIETNYGDKYEIKAPDVCYGNKIKCHNIKPKIKGKVDMQHDRFISVIPIKRINRYIYIN